MRILASASRLAFTSFCYIFLFFILVTGAQAADFDISSEAQIIQSRLMFDRSNNTSYLDISIKNISQRTLQVPIKIIIQSISDSRVTLSNADGITSDSKPYYDYSASIAGGILSPGATSSVRRVIFKNPNRVAFSFQIMIIQQVEAEAAAIIGPEGGTVEVSDPNSPIYKARIEVPSNLFSSPVRFTIKAPDADMSMTPLLEREQQISPVVDFSASTPLTGEVTICLPINAQTSVDLPLLFSFDENKNDWRWEITQPEVNSAKTEVCASVNHFTRFVIIMPYVAAPAQASPSIPSIPSTPPPATPPVCLRVNYVKPPANPMVLALDGTRGSTLKLMGWGFTYRGEAKLHLMYPDGSEALPKYVSVNGWCDLGTYEYEWNVPSDAPVGLYKYWAEDLESGKVSLISTFSVTDNVPSLPMQGTVWTWGYNEYGQLGNGTTTDSSTPVQVTSLSDITAINGGYLHTVALKSDGTVWTWGWNEYGQLGNGTTTDSPVPVQVNNLSGVTNIAAGGYHTIALKSDGNVWTWGYNVRGQLGNGTTTDSLAPVQVNNLSGVTNIAAGGYHTIALKSDGTIWTSGHNYFGQLGNGTRMDSPVPVQVNNLSGVTDIAGGLFHTVALKSDGTVWIWGDSNYDQISNAPTTDSLTPVQVNNLSGVTKIAAGYHHTAALKTDGTVWTWGWNVYGQLGNGTITDSPTPVQVNNLNGVMDIAAGAYYTVALKSDGTVWIWGFNYYDGQFENEPTSITTPVQVNNLSGVTDIAGGYMHSITLIPDGI